MEAKALPAVKCRERNREGPVCTSRGRGRGRALRSPSACPCLGDRKGGVWGTAPGAGRVGRPRAVGELVGHLVSCPQPGTTARAS